MAEEPHVINQQCPECGQDSLRYDARYGLYECTDDKCGAIYNQRDLDRIKGSVIEREAAPVAPEEHQLLSTQKPAGTTAPAVSRMARRNVLIGILSVIGGSFATAALLTFVIYPALYSSLMPPAAFEAEAGNGENILSWEEGANAEGVVLVFDVDNYPSSVDDGTVLYTGSATGYVHEGLEYDDKVYYSIWSYTSSGDQFQYSEYFKTDTATPYWEGPRGERINEYVEYSSDSMVAGADGELIRLVNNPDAQQLNWNQIKQFLLDDETDEVIYEDGVFVCADFAEVLHNNAEAAGIRCAYVVIHFVDEEMGHACNMFDTADQGIVYVDCTGSEEGDVNADKTIDLAVGQEYQPEAVFPEIGANWSSMGEVDQFWVVW